MFGLMRVLWFCLMKRESVCARALDVREKSAELGKKSS